jgi:hypothetical protein
VEIKVLAFCKDFFLKTLDISQRRINYFFERVVKSETEISRSLAKEEKDETSTNQKSYESVP